MRFVKLLKQYNFLEKFIIVYTLWSIFTGFRHSFGGITANLFYGWFNLIIQFCLIITFFQYYGSRSYMFNVTYKKCVFTYAIGYLLCAFFSFDGALESFNRYILPILYGSGFIMLKEERKLKIFDAVIRVVAIIFALSAAEYILYILSHYRLELFTTIDNDRIITQSLFNNFFEEYAIIPRFMSLCEEPGTVGTLCGLLLYAVGKLSQYRKQYIIFWLCGLLSFSMAFYVLATIHMFTIKLKNPKLILILVVMVVILYNYFGEYFNYLIIERLESGDTDNRVSDSVNKYIVRAWQDGRLWFGNKASFLSSMGFYSGVKALLVRHGILGVSSLVMGYTFSFLKMAKTRNIDCIFFLIAFWASFYQREYIDRIEFLMVFFTMPAILYMVRNNSIKIVNKKSCN